MTRGISTYGAWIAALDLEVGTPFYKVNEKDPA